MQIEVNGWKYTVIKHKDGTATQHLQRGRGSMPQELKDFIEKNSFASVYHVPVDKSATKKRFDRKERLKMPEKDQKEREVRKRLTGEE